MQDLLDQELSAKFRSEFNKMRELNIQLYEEKQSLILKLDDYKKRVLKTQRKYSKAKHNYEKLCLSQQTVFQNFIEKTKKGKNTKKKPNNKLDMEASEVLRLTSSSNKKEKSERSKAKVEVSGSGRSQVSSAIDKRTFHKLQREKENLAKLLSEKVKEFEDMAASYEVDKAKFKKANEALELNFTKLGLKTQENEDLKQRLEKTDKLYERQVDENESLQAQIANLKDRLSGLSTQDLAFDQKYSALLAKKDELAGQVQKLKKRESELEKALLKNRSVSLDQTAERIISETQEMVPKEAPIPTILVMSNISFEPVNGMIERIRRETIASREEESSKRLQESKLVMSDLEADLSQRNDELSNLKEENQRNLVELEKKVKRIVQLEAEIKENQEELKKSAEQELNETRQKQKTIEDFKNQLKSLRAELDSLRAESQSLREEKVKLEGELEKAKNSNIETKKEFGSQLEAKEVEMEALKKMHEQNAASQALKQSKQGEAKTKIASLEEQLEQAKKLLGEQKEAFQQKENTYRETEGSLNLAKQDLQEELDHTKIELKNAKQEIEGSKEDKLKLVELKNEYQKLENKLKSRETAGGSSTSRIQELENQLKEERALRTAKAEEHLKQLNDAIKNANSSKAYKQRQRELIKQADSGDASLEDLIEIDTGKYILELEKQLKQLKADQTTLKGNYNKSQEQCLAMNQYIKGIKAGRGRVKNLQNDLKQKTQVIAQLQAKNSKLQHMVDEGLQKRAEDMDAKYAGFVEMIGDLEDGEVKEEGSLLEKYQQGVGYLVKRNMGLRMRCGLAGAGGGGAGSGEVAELKKKLESARDEAERFQMKMSQQMMMMSEMSTRAETYANLLRKNKIKIPKV